KLWHWRSTAKGIKTGTTTNNYGYFSITIPADTATFQISYIGYQTIDTQIQTCLINNNSRLTK
ncbi:hypothetical protein TH53_09795, partial [Pedobacter lusitanus]